MSIEARRGRRHASLALALAALLVALGAPPTAWAAGGSWSVTAWGERWEIFPEVEPLIAGKAAAAHTHVTRLADFAPLQDGTVEIVLRGAAGEEVFAASEPARPGIFTVEITAPAAGEYTLYFRVRETGDAASFEEVRGGEVRVGRAENPGGVAVAPAPRGALEPSEPVAFLKEEQWRSDFGTAWVRSGRLARAVAGLARVRPPAGGEALLTAPVDGVVRPVAAATTATPWPHPGLAMSRNAAIFEVVPHVAAARSLAELEADTAALVAEKTTAQARLERLEQLLELEAASQREVEEARTRVEILAARHDAAARDLEAARASREGGAGEGLLLRAPFSGQIARVDVSPGATVQAGDPLARLVRTDLVWLEVALAPAAARRVAAAGVRGAVLRDPESEPARLGDGLRLVSVAPEVSPRTGTVTVLLESPRSAGLILGTTFEAQVLLPEEREGIVIPSSAVVDDGGVSVVYLQLDGESFVRQEVRVIERQGERLLVEGLLPGQRLVTRGGHAIRRSSLMASGEAHGHVH